MLPYSSLLSLLLYFSLFTNFTMTKISPIPVVRPMKDWHTCRHCNLGYSTFGRGEWHFNICDAYLNFLHSSQNNCKSQHLLVGLTENLIGLQDVAHNQNARASATKANMETPSSKPKWPPGHHSRKCSIL
ncbi:hypothetical protein BGW37DRAFT_268264 [Umbelopsis sp. PMI_123]|nr:hypothetical protein BGW37DRAFT_268264 [Umbelopsis sp. PMI_123]